MKRPIISNYQDLALFIGDTLKYRKSNEQGFSILSMSSSLRRVSPTLVTLVVSGKRKLTFDRCEEFAKLLDLTANEKNYLKDWVLRLGGEDGHSENIEVDRNPIVHPRRKQASIGLLSDWLNVFVKDAFQLKSVKKYPKNLYSLLAGIASQSRIDKSLRFLLKQGYLRRNLNGEISEEVVLHSIDSITPHQKIRAFHKATLKIAASAIDQFPSSERFGNALIIPLTEKKYQELSEMVSGFSEQLQKFAEGSKDGDSLYQVIVHISPTGGNHGSKNKKN